MRKEFEVSVEELRYLCLKCAQPECQTEIVLDMNATRVHIGAQQETPTPEKCPSCGTSFDSAVKPNVDLFRQFYKALRNNQSNLVFRLRTPI